MATRSAWCYPTMPLDPQACVDVFAGKPLCPKCQSPTTGMFGILSGNRLKLGDGQGVAVVWDECKECGWNHHPIPSSV